MMKEHFGNVNVKGEVHSSSYGAIKKVTVERQGKKVLVIGTDMDSKADNETAMDTIKVYNEFLLAVTGFTGKERKKRM